MLQTSSEMASPQQPGFSGREQIHQLQQVAQVLKQQSSPRPLTLTETNLKGKESKHGEFEEQDRKGLSARAECLLVKEEEACPLSLDTFTEGSKRERLFMAEKKVQLKFDMKVMRSELREIKKAITVQEREVERLEDAQAHKDHCLEEFRKLAEKKAVDAQSLLLKAIKPKQEMDNEIEKLTDETGILKSEIAELEKDLNKYKRYRRILFTLFLPEWQEAQQAETLRTKVLPKRAEGLERFMDSSPDTVLPSTSESALSSDQRDTLVKNSKLDGDSTIYKDKLEIYFSDPQRVLDQLSELKDQTLFLCENLTRVDKTMEKTTEITKKKINEDEEKLTKQVEDVEHRVNFEKKRVAMLTKKIQFHESLKTGDQDIKLHSLARKVTEVYSSCVDNQPTTLSTLEKLFSIERHMFLLQEETDSIPEETVKELRRIKNNERRNRQREEKHKLEMEKNREMIKKYMQRSMDEGKKPKLRLINPSNFFPVSDWKIEPVRTVSRSQLTGVAPSVIFCC